MEYAMEFSYENQSLGHVCPYFSTGQLSLCFSVTICSQIGVCHFERGGTLHIYAGYIVIGFVLARLIWGFIGSHHARFKKFHPQHE